MANIQWCVYDVKVDEVIGVWNTYEDAEVYYNDHVDLFEGHLQLFPWDEFCIPSAL